MRTREFFDTQYLTHPEGWGFSERKSQLFRYEIYLGMISRICPVPQRVLELGCGEGYFSSLLNKRIRCRVTGIDLSHVAIERAKEKGGNISFLEASVTALPWTEVNKEGKPDLVILGEVLTYLEEAEQRACIEDIRRNAEPGTHILVSVNLGPKPYFSRGQLSELFRGFTQVESRGIYMRSYYRLVESYLWHLRCRLGGVGKAVFGTTLRYAPIGAINQISKWWSEDEESIHVALFKPELV